MNPVTIQSWGTVTSPTAGQSLLNQAGASAGVMNVPPGTYLVTAALFFSGTVSTAIDADNVQLYADGTPVPGAVMIRAGAGVQAGDPDNSMVKWVVQANASFELRAIAAGSASGVYWTRLVAAPVSSPAQVVS